MNFATAPSNTLFSASTSVLIAYLRLYPPLVWQMWQQKNATYWGTSARRRFVLICARESEWDKFSYSSRSTFSGSRIHDIHSHQNHFILQHRTIKFHNDWNIFVTFLRFFPSLGQYPPYTYRGARWRCAPFSFFFHGESHSHIYADTSDNIAQRQSAQSASFKRESCTFTNIQSRYAINPNRSLDRSL